MSIAFAPGRTGEWMADPGFGVYVHIPFCAHRCHYCDFNTYEGLDQIHESYVGALISHIERSAFELGPATSVFFGGGTPTMLTPKMLGRILGAIRQEIGIASDAEITIEANPETVDESVFSDLLEFGFHRFSIGVQSAVPHVLAGLGRRHTAERAFESLAAARLAGVADLNADVIFGSPWESPEDWRTTLDAVVAAETDHISAYALTIEEGTPLQTLIATGRVPDVDPDVQAARHETASVVLASAGFNRYEVSNWARPGRASRHNLLYWSAGEYAAFGAGAHGHIAGERFWNTRLPREYIGQISVGGSPTAGAEVLDPDRRSGEALMLGLRLVSGVYEKSFEARFPGGIAARRDALAELVALGLLEQIHGWLRLSEKGTLVANYVFEALL